MILTLQLASLLGVAMLGRGVGESVARTPGVLPLVVLDAGHGGEQSGAIGVCGVKEKDVTLGIVSELERLLLASKRVEVLLTRRDDTTTTLEDRVRKTNASRAVLFLSVHANAAQNATSRGVETFFVSRRASDKRIQQLALVENEGELENESDETLGLILDSLRLNAAYAESQRFAALVQESVSTRQGELSRGVLQAPFVVLRQVNVPSVLVEVGFLTNEAECKSLATTDYQRRLAQALAAGVLAHLWIVGDTSMATPRLIQGLHTMGD